MLPVFMKILSYSLFCFIFCFLGLCDDEEEDKCTKLDTELNEKIVGIVSVLNAEDTGAFKACTYGYTLEFYKEHCGGDLSGMMSYEYIGCEHLDEEYTNVPMVFGGLWEIKFSYEEDILNVNFVDPRFNGKITRASITGKEIYRLTNGGKKLFAIYATIYAERVEIIFSS